MKEKKKYKCIYDGNITKTIWVENGYDECMFEITHIFKRLKLVRTTANKDELSILKIKAKEYLKELIKNHLL
jgi:hypothetical protein